MPDKANAAKAMTIPPADPKKSRRSVRARHRAASIERIIDHIADGAMDDLPDVCLALIERAMTRDLQGIAELARNYLLFAPDES